MAGVFLSYARFDSELGERIIAGLRSLDVECWWDRDMPGVDWPREIERQIDTMSALVVVWTAASKDSKYVRAEAIPAFDREKLVNIMVGVHEPPLPFNLYNGFQLDGWTGREPHENWTRFVKTLEAKLVKTGEVKPGQLSAALGRREQGVRRRQAALTDAEETFAAAKAADGEADAVLAEAKTALARAEEQLSQVNAMHAGPNVIRGAQADLDDARNGVKDAETARKASAAALATASRALARAKTAIDTAFVSPPELESEPDASPDTASDLAEADSPDPADAPRAAAREAVAEAPPQPAAEPPPTIVPSSASAPQSEPVASRIGAASLAADAAAGGVASAAPVSAGSASSSTPGEGPSSLGARAGAGVVAAKRSSPLPLVLGGGAVVVVGLIAIALFSGHHPAAQTGPADNAAGNVAVATQPSPAPVPAPAPAPAVDPAVTAAQAMVGAWSGNGAVCGTNPLTVAFDAASKTVRETLSDTPSLGSVVGLRPDGSVQVNFSSDGHTEYDQVSGDKLTLTFPTGSMTYQRC